MIDPLESFMAEAIRSRREQPSPPARRVPPFRPVPEHDASILRTLFRGARFPDTEWWWNTIHVHGIEPSGEKREFSIVTNVQLLAEPLRGEVSPAAVVAVRDVATGDRWVARSRGTMGSSLACRYSSPGWLLLRLDPDADTFETDAFGVGLDPASARERYPGGCYVVDVREEAFELSLRLRQYKTGVFGEEGWIDYNPKGAVPLWASAKCRIQEPEGTLVLRMRGGESADFVLTGGYAHFEHQCIVATESARPFLLNLVHSERSADTLTELLQARPRWHWFRADLGEGVHLSAYTMWNPRTGAPYRDFCALLGPEGSAVFPDAVEFSTPHDDGRQEIDPAPVVSFVVPPGEHGVAPGWYSVTFRQDVGFDWGVPYACPLGRVCDARESHCRVDVRRDDQLVLENGSGAQETIDLVSSIVRDERRRR